MRQKVASHGYEVSTFAWPRRHRRTGADAAPGARGRGRDRRREDYADGESAIPTAGDIGMSRAIHSAWKCRRAHRPLHRRGV